MKRFLIILLLTIGIILTPIVSVISDVDAQSPIVYPPEVKTDYEKLLCVYSLLEQMRLEHNEAGAIAKSDWKKYQDQWYIYAEKFNEKQKPLLAEYVRLKEAIRKDTYTDAEWDKLTVDQTADALEILYGDKEVLKELPTLATSDLLDQLKAIDFLALKGVAPPDPLEDWTTYTENDGDGFIEVAANTLTITNMDRDGSFIYKDFTADHFGTVLTNPHLVSAEVTAHSGTAVMLLFHTLSNATAPTYYTDPVIMCYAYPSNEDIHLTIDDGATDQTDAWGNYVENIIYYMTFDRDGSGTSLKIYSDASRTTLVDTLAVAQGSTSFQYLHSVAPLGGAGSNTISAKIYNLDLQEAGVSAPTVVINAVTNIEATTATFSANITATGGENATAVRFQCGTAPGVYDVDNWTDYGDFGIGEFIHNATGLPPGDTLYVLASANNSAGWGTSSETSFLTKPAAPTNVSAGDGSSTDNVTITWTKSNGATGYYVRRDGTPVSGLLGDVATYTDTGADAPTITAGSTVASDGSSTANISLSLSGTSANNGTTHSYDVIANNASGNSTDSANDAGYRGIGSLGYQWYRSSGDADSGYSVISGATSSTYTDNTTPAPTITAGTASASDNTSPSYVTLSISGDSADPGDGRYYQCELSATGAANQTSASNRGYRGVGTLTYQWQRSSGDSDADYSNITGATTDPYNDTDGVVTPDGRYYKCVLNATGATQQTTNSDRGNKAVAPDAPPDAPTGFTLSDLGGVIVNANWVASANATDFLLLVSRTGYPSSPTGGDEIAYSGTSTTSNLTGYALDTQEYYFSLWAWNVNGYSTEYATATIGDTVNLTGYIMEEDMEVLEQPLSNLFLLGLISSLVVLAFWKQDAIIAIIAGIIIILVSVEWFDDYPGASLILWGLAIYMIAFKGVIALLQLLGPARGLSQFKQMFKNARGKGE